MGLMSLLHAFSNIFEKRTEIYCKSCGKTARADEDGNYYCVTRKCPQRRADRIEDFDYNKDF